MDWIVQIFLFCLSTGLICVSVALISHIRHLKRDLLELKNEIRTTNQELISEIEDKKNEKSAPEFDEKEIENIWGLAKYASENGRSASFTVKDLIDAKRILLDTRKYKTRQEYPCEYYAGPDGKLTRYIKV